MSGISGTSPVSVSHTPAEGSSATVSLASGYGDTQNPYASKTANTFLAAPNGSSGVPSFRAIAAADVPTLNQNTTGTASNITASSNTSLTSLSNLTSVGSLSSLTVTGNVTVDTNTLFVNSSTNRVGVVNASPSYALDVTGDINASTALRIGGNTIGTFTSYTPTIGTGSGTITTLGAVSGKWTRVGKYVFVYFDFAITTNGTGGTFLTVSKPVTSVTPTNTGALGVATEIAVSGTFGVVRDNSTTAVLITGTPGSATYMGANGVRIAGHFSYEAA
jgi:hypothetical protein